MNTCTERIVAWMKETVESVSYLRFNDLELQKIDASYVNPSKWYLGACHYLNLACGIRNSLGYHNMWVMVGFTLKSCNHKIGITFNSALQLRDEFCDTPPKFYLMASRQESWLKTPKEEVKSAKFSDIPNGALCYYSEYLTDDDPDYRRAFWLAFPPLPDPN